MAIVSISGKAQSGKDTVGEILQNLFRGKKYFEGVGWVLQADSVLLAGLHHSKKWEIKKFAGKLKSSIEHKFPNAFNAEKWEKGGSGYRDILIYSLDMTRRELLINEAMALRGICKDYWVMALFDEYRKQTLEWDSEGNSKLDRFPNWIITDMRFPNEMRAVEKMNGITIRVERKGIPKIDSISETSLDKGFVFDHVINNDGTLLELIRQVEQIYKSIINELSKN